MEQLTFKQLTDHLIRFYSEGKYAEALEIVDQNSDRFPEQTARTTFWKMCLLSLCARSDDVISLFQKGLDSGLWWSESLFVDTDLDAVRDLPEFKRLMAESSKKSAEMQAYIRPARTLLVPDDTSAKLPLLIGLHGRGGHHDANLEHWAIAQQRGWLVLSPQSRQALYQGSYYWDDGEQGLKDILFHVEEISRIYNIDHERIIVAGISQGSGMAVYTALSGRTDVRGFIGVASWWADPGSLTPQTETSKRVRGYFISGEKDHTLETAKKIQQILKEHNIQFVEEVHPDLGHEFPTEFEKSFEKAIDFIFKEHE